MAPLGEDLREDMVAAGDTVRRVAADMARRAGSLREDMGRRAGSSLRDTGHQEGTVPPRVEDTRQVEVIPRR
jgi:hypothetical protein